MLKGSKFKNMVVKSKKLWYSIVMGTKSHIIHFKSFLIFLQRYFSTLMKQKQNIVISHNFN